MHKYIALLSCFFFLHSFGQSYSTNPYSQSGLGDEGGFGDAVFVGVGGIKSVMVDSTIVNFYNPSSYSFLAKGQPLVSLNVAGRISKISEGDQSQTGSVGNLSHIALAFPVTKNFGFAVGLTPFSRKGYNLSTTQAVGSDSVTYMYRGVGTTQRVFSGVSYKLINSKKTQFAVGGNLAYIFGSVSNERYSAFKGVTTAGLDENVFRMNSLYYDLGLTYKYSLDSLGRSNIVFGATYVPAQSLNATTDYALYSTGTDPFNRGAIIDTVTYNVGQKGSISYPSTLTFGGAYYYSPSNYDGHLKMIYQLGIMSEYSHTTWSTYKENFSAHSSPEYKDGMRFSLGVTYRPSIIMNTKASGGTFFNRLQYKTGFYTQSMPLQTSGGQLRESAVSLGVSIPIAAVRNNSNVNISVAGGSRSNGSAVGLSEKFLTISFGVILSPSKNDQWFRRYKLD